MKIIRAIICFTYIILAAVLCREYVIWNTTAWIGIMMIPMLFNIQNGNLSIRFLAPAILFTLLSVTIPAKSTLFFALITSSLLFVECFKGKLDLNVFFAIMFISPLFTSVSDTISFPLRLWLSEVVANTIAAGGLQAESVGNIIKVKGYDFYIDQACAGLKMLNISLLVALFILSVKQKKFNLSPSLIQYFAVLLFTILLNLIANYFRILAIVIFKIMPGTVLHDFTGIICLVIYVIIPLMLILGPFVSRFGEQRYDVEKQGYSFAYPKFKLPSVHILLFSAILYVSFAYKQRVYVHPNHQMIQLDGFNKTILDNETLKFENNTALVYMKPSIFYSPEHNPMICWTGSGYEFKFIRKETIKGREIYIGTMTKGNETLYASWWFDDGKTKTIDQLSWRWKSAMGSNFYLVNVTAAREADLKKITLQLLPSPFAGNP